MPRARRKKPPTLYLDIAVLHPESMDWGRPPEGHTPATYHDQQCRHFPADRDGHHISYGMRAARPAAQTTLELSLPRGMAAQSVADLLRKIADLLEKNPELMTIRQGHEGHFCPDGTAEKCPLSLDDAYDDLGNLNVPEIFPLPKREEPPQ